MDGTRAAAGDDGGGLGLLLRWGLLVLALVLGGLVLAARALDSYTTIFGLLLSVFGVLLAFRLLMRVTP